MLQQSVLTLIDFSFFLLEVELWRVHTLPWVLEDESIYVLSWNCEGSLGIFERFSRDLPLTHHIIRSLNYE